MSRERYIRLIEDFCKHVGLPDSSHILHGGPILADEILFSLLHSEEEESNPDVMFVYCDYGDVPPEKEAQVYRALLNTNLLLYTGNGPSFTVSPTTNRVVLADHYPLEGLDAVTLHRLLSERAAHAKLWRSTHFLETAPQPPAQEPLSIDQNLYFSFAKD